MILNQGNEETLHFYEYDQKNIVLIKSNFPTLDQEKTTRDGEGMIDLKARKYGFEKGILLLMWDNRKWKLGMHKKFDSLWLGL